MGGHLITLKLARAAFTVWLPCRQPPQGEDAVNLPAGE